MQMNDYDPVAYFYACLRMVEKEFPDEIEHFRTINLVDITPSIFLAELAHTIFTSGFSWRVINSLYNRGLADAFRNWDIEEICNNCEKVRQDALMVFNYPPKVDAILDGARRLSEVDWPRFRDRLLGSGGLSLIRSFKYIGPITQYHLARNIGLDVAKPDRHMCRMAERFGYAPTEDGVTKLVQTISSVTGERPGLVDYVLWRSEERGYEQQ
jgi:hypothetical protein